VEAAALRWVVVVEQNLEGLVVQLVAQPEQQPCIVDNTGHRLHNLRTPHMDLDRLRNTGRTEPRIRHLQ
jgi:hypothetical protein